MVMLVKFQKDYPPGWLGYLALCYEYYKNNYRHVGGVYYENCEPSYIDLGEKGFFFFIFLLYFFFKIYKISFYIFVIFIIM